MDNEIPPVGRERDAAIATACGWIDIDAEDIITGRPPSRIEYHEVPHYSTDLTAAFGLGIEAERMGFEDGYTSRLCEMCAKAGRGDSFGVAHASADARSAAWLRAWREWKGRQDGAN